MTIHGWLGRAALWLLGLMLVFTPWAFGTTQPWSVRVMMSASAVLGVAFAARWALRFAGKVRRQRSAAVIVMAGLTALLLGWTLISAVNARSTYLPSQWRLEERAHVQWLPHSYDAPATWAAFWQFLAQAAAFWIVYDLMADARARGSRSQPHLSSRLRLLLWIMTLNATAVALEAIIQRTSGTPNLLWIMPTHENKDALSQFGPYAYRANAAQYLNLVWPVALGFWWWLHQDRSQRVTRRGLHHVLLPCVVTIAAASLFSLSRGGVGVAALMVVAVCVLFVMRREAPVAVRAGVLGLGALILVAGLFISWKTLGKRLEDSMHDPLVGRREIYTTAEGMLRDYPWFGTGPGTFATLFQLYRRTPDEYWPTQLHNDWMEFRITFGWLGFMLMFAAVSLTMARWLVRGGVPRDSFFLLCIACAMAGCLLHARFDFPFQIYSIQFYFLVLAAVLFSSSGRATASLE